VLEGHALTALRVDIQRLRVGVRSIELKAVAQTLVSGDPEGVVTRVARAFPISNILQRHSGCDWAGQRQSREWPDGIQRGVQERLFKFSHGSRVLSFRAEVSKGYGQSGSDFALNVNVP